jgi:hypothetical protein
MTFTRFLKPSNLAKKTPAFQKTPAFPTDTPARAASVPTSPLFRSVRSRPLSRF